MSETVEQLEETLSIMRAKYRDVKDTLCVIEEQIKSLQVAIFTKTTPLKIGQRFRFPRGGVAQGEISRFEPESWGTVRVFARRVLKNGSLHANETWLTSSEIQEITRYL